MKYLALIPSKSQSYNLVFKGFVSYIVYVAPECPLIVSDETGWTENIVFMVHLKFSSRAWLAVTWQTVRITGLAFEFRTCGLRSKKHESHVQNNH